MSNPGNSGGRKENVNAVDIIEIVDVDDQEEYFDYENETLDRTFINPSELTLQKEISCYHMLIGCQMVV